MKTEQRVVHQCAQGHIIKQIGHHRPHFGRLILPQAFLVKPIYLCRLSALVVSTQKSDVIGVTQLQQNHQKNRLQSVVSSVHKIPKE